MNKILTASILVLICFQMINTSQVSDAVEDQIEREFDNELMEKREASQFLKRLFHPFSTKNEEIKRETREVYEEKCESIVPTQRFCPDLKTWQAFKNYENGE